MGATQNVQNPFPLPDNLTQDWLIPYAFASGAIPVSVGDLMYYKGTVAGGDVAYPADQLATLGTEALDQVQFARLFVGASQGKILAAEVNATKRLPIRSDCVMLAKCPSQTWKHGDLVGIYSSGAALDPQQVDKVTSYAAAIGVCVKDQPTASTTVTFRCQSRYSDSFGTQLVGLSLFDGQPMSAANVLTDAAQVFTVATPQFSTMQNGAARTITLPKESASKGLVFIVYNNAASVGNVTFLGNTTTALGTLAIPAGKVGYAFCDGTTWYGFVSA